MSTGWYITAHSHVISTGWYIKAQMMFSQPRSTRTQHRKLKT
jgi:hypothetical protein